MTRSKNKVTLSILVAQLLIGIILLGFWAFSVVRQAKLYQVAYDLTQTGDSRGDVIERFGHPSKAIPCQNRNSPPVCAEQLEYITLFERWIVSLGKEDKVIHKSHGVSF